MNAEDRNAGDEDEDEVADSIALAFRTKVMRISGVPAWLDGESVCGERIVTWFW